MDKFNRAKEVFTEGHDKAMLDEQEKVYTRFLGLAELAETDTGRSLVSWLTNQISESIQALFRDKSVEGIYALESYVNLLSNLTDAKSSAEAIERWLDSVIEKNG